MRVVALLILILSASLLVTAQTQVRGQVVNRDGQPLECQVDFYVGDKLTYGLKTDYRGYFVLSNPRYGRYRVEVIQGNNRNWFEDVVIDPNGLHPPTLVVRW